MLPKCSPWNAICGFDTRGVFAFKAIFLRTDEEHGFARYTGGKFSKFRTGRSHRGAQRATQTLTNHSPL